MVGMQPVVDQPLGYLLHRIAAALLTEVTATALAPLGLTFPQCICMRMLSQSPGMSSADLARKASVTPQAMNVVLQRLQERGLVRRPDNASSGRSLPAELTCAGVELLNRAEFGMRSAERRALAKLGQEDRRALRRMLAAVGE